MLVDRFKHLEVATYTIVLVIATQFRTEGPILLLQWRMAILPTPCPDCSHKPAQSFPDRLALDDPVSTACLGPIVGKSQNVECPLAVCRSLSTWRLFALDQHRLFGMNGQTETTEPFRQDLHDPVGVCFLLEADDEIIGKTRQEAPTFHPRLTVLDNPFV